MPSILPNELVSAIIEGFGKSETSLSYRLPKESVTILVTLCHVNHTFKALTEPVLYSRAIVTPVNIEAFTYAVLGPDASSEPDQPLQTRYVGGKASVIKSLAFLRFRKPGEDIDKIVSILRCLKPSLERLLLDVQSYHTVVEPLTLSMAIGEMQVLTEFATTFLEHYWGPPTPQSRLWPRQSAHTLRCIALHDVSIAVAVDVLRSLEHTERFIFSDPVLEVGDDSLLSFGVQSRDKRHREIIWIMPRIVHRMWARMLNQRLEKAFVEEGANDVRVKMAMYVIVTPSLRPVFDPQRPREMFCAAVVGGSGWSAEKTWDEYMA